jgi:hypothetical protein
MLPLWFQWCGVAVAALLVGVLAVGTAIAWHTALVRAVGRVALLYTVEVRVIEFAVPALRIIGRE